jgi:hypothetical protein
MRVKTGHFCRFSMNWPFLAPCVKKQRFFGLKSAVFDQKHPKIIPQNPYLGDGFPEVTELFQSKLPCV